MARRSHESALGTRLCEFRLIAPSPSRLLVYPSSTASEHVAVRELDGPDGRAVATRMHPEAICLPVPICRDGRSVGVTGSAGNRAVTKPSCITRQAGGGGFGRLPCDRATIPDGPLQWGVTHALTDPDCVSTKGEVSIEVVSDVAEPARRARAGGFPSWRGAAACRRSTTRVFRPRSD